MLKAVIFDMGGTLEDVAHTPECNIPCGTKILSYLEQHGIKIDMDSESFMKELETRYRQCRAKNDQWELPPFELWSEWYLKGMHSNNDMLRIIANNISNIWERTFYRRALRPETPQLLEQLKAQGIKMGIISNTGCLTQVIEILHEYGIHQYFGCIYLSSLSGFRKPHPGIFHAAARDLGVLPAESIYVGDTISRDVRGARFAGYLASIRINSELTGGSDAGHGTEGEEADYMITSLLEIPAITKKLIHEETNVKEGKR